MARHPTPESIPLLDPPRQPGDEKTPEKRLTRNILHGRQKTTRIKRNRTKSRISKSRCIRYNSYSRRKEAISPDENRNGGQSNVFTRLADVPSRCRAIRHKDTPSPKGCLVLVPAVSLHRPVDGIRAQWGNKSKSTFCYYKPVMAQEKTTNFGL